MLIPSFILTAFLFSKVDHHKSYSQEEFEKVSAHVCFCGPEQSGCRGAADSRGGMGAATTAQRSGEGKVAVKKEKPRTPGETHSPHSTASNL